MPSKSSQGGGPKAKATGPVKGAAVKPAPAKSASKVAAKPAAKVAAKPAAKVAAKPAAKAKAASKAAAQAPLAKSPAKAPLAKAAAKAPLVTSPAKAAPAAPARVAAKPAPAAKASPKPATAKASPARQGKPNYDKDALGSIRKRLQEQRDQLQTQLTAIEESAAGLSQSEMSGEVSYDEDFADAGSFTFDREKEFSIANNVTDLRSKTDRALHKIEEGSYGICESCGQPIEAARLKALPHVTLCLKCKKAEERR